jgi:hypothetical protein
MSQFELIAPTLFGLEGIAGDELRRMNMENVRVEDRRVFFTGDEQALANGFMEEMDYANGDKIMMPTMPLMMDSLGPVKTQIAPLVGADTAEVLLNLGYTQEQIDAMDAAGSIRVLKK